MAPLIMEGNHLCNFSRRHHKVHFCEIISNSDQWFRRCHLKDFFSGALWVLLFGGAEPFYAVLVAGI